MGKTKMDICTKCWGAGRVHGGDENSTWSKTCEDCHGIGFVRVPMTNADRIRAMTDEELAEFLDDVQYREWEYRQENPREKGYFQSCVEGWLNWLQQPAEGD